MEGSNERFLAWWRNLWTFGGRPLPAVGATPSEVLHRENKWRLLRYRPRPEGIAYATPVLLVPSLINRPYVLDLQPGRSLVEFLVGLGHDVFLVDWGTPGPEDRYLTFDEVADRYLGRALRIASDHGRRGKAHLLGYCLGGTLAVIHAAARPERVASVGTLGAPMTFRDDGLLSAWSATPTFDVASMIEAFGNAPWFFLQAGFQFLRPTLPLWKLVHLLDRLWDDEYVDGFLALETWGADNVSFPGACYVRYIEELYRGDALARGTFRLSGSPARMEDLRCPTLAVTFEHDRIVPWRSGALLVERTGAADKEWIHLPGGHVGAVVSRKASQNLWPRLSAFWAARDDEPSAARRGRRRDRPSSATGIGADLRGPENWGAGLRRRGRASPRAP